MKFSVNWINEFWKETIDVNTLELQLTSLGLEVEKVEPACNNKLEHIVVAEIISAEPHPNADKLQVCQVTDGYDQYQIVCGAKNARAGIKIPLAKIGSKFSDFKIKKAKLRGIESFGMLCSEAEIGLSENSDGLMELASDAPTGTAIYNYLDLDDTLIEVDITPNRGDCLSLQGIARDIAAKNNLNFVSSDCLAKETTGKETKEVHITEPKDCLAYASKIIKNININAQTPLWLSEKLRRSDLRTISPIVDITNFVMLELGQPMHAFDFDKVKGDITVRYANNNEEIILLDKSIISMTDDTLVIADDDGAIAIAGIMGGLRTSVDKNTCNILLESAAFNPLAIVGKQRFYGINTDSAHRFERGVDYQLQTTAIERATILINNICNGENCPTKLVEGEQKKQPIIFLKENTIERLLGIHLEQSTIINMLKSLNMDVKQNKQGLDVTAPSYRFDINIEADLVEEIARLYGYENIQRQSPKTELIIKPIKNKTTEIDSVKNLLVSRGYTETITYSFIDEKSYKLFSQDEGIKLNNPISSELSVMRNSIWPGLLKVLAFNLKRQQNRIRIFEEGLVFIQADKGINQEKYFSGLIYGSRYSENWSGNNETVDFYDVKGDVETILLKLGIDGQQYQINNSNDNLHPGQSADIMLNRNCIGRFGRVHPDIEKAFNISNPCFVFELRLDKIPDQKKVKYHSISPYPSIKRDFAIVMDKDIRAQQLLDSIFNISCKYLNDVKIFDIYDGKGVDSNSKSIALNISFQSNERTLSDEDISSDIDNIIHNLKKDIGARLRD